MTTDVELDQMGVTRAERFLALILAVFVLIGALWIYSKIDEIGRPDVSYESIETPEQSAAIAARDRAAEASTAAQDREANAADELERRREAYRTALDAGRPAAELERAYRQAEARFEAAQRAQRAAAATLRRAEGPAAQAEARVEAELQRRIAEGQRTQTRHDWITFIVRLVYVLGALAFAYWWFGRVRRRRPRLMLIAMAAIGAFAVQAFVMAGDYATDYFDVLELGPIVLSLVGIVLTGVALAALQRYIARRLPSRRVRKSECPFCGYPVGAGRHCEGCGRPIIGDCTSCAAPRRIGTEHCTACGAR